MKKKMAASACLGIFFFLSGIRESTLIKAKYSETNKETVLAHVIVSFPQLLENLDLNFLSC